MTEPFVSLARYAQLMCIEGCGFWGVNNPDEAQNCSTIWSACERDTLAFFLHEAQHEIEHFVGYPLIKSWFAGERHVLGNPISLNWLNLIELGTKKVTDISLCEAVAGSGAAQVITIDCAAIDQSLMIPANVVVYHPGTDHVITPSSVTYDTATDTLTINLPSCVTALENNPDTGWDYNDADSYEDCVDVKVISSTPANITLISPPTSCDTDCAADTVEVCGYIKSYEMSMVSPGNSCSSGFCNCRNYQFANVSYSAGLTERDPVLETAVIRLAHSKMPTAPCGCDPVKMNWTRDTHIPDIMTPERANCPFGMNDGAFVAWQFVKTKVLMRGSGL